MNRHLKRHLEMERLFGADFLPLRRRGPEATQRKTTSTTQRPPVRKESPPVAKAPGFDYPTEFLEFMKPVLECTKCGLCETRTQVVFGVGPIDAPLMFVGEAPGGDEDLQGEPFVGRAGQLLTKTLKKAGVERSRVYIANILKCRPPGNRTPQFDEMAACMPYLMKQIQFIKPKLLCALGNIAAQTLLNSKTGITRIRGRVQLANGLRIFPAYHPAYVLRNMRELTLFETDIRAVCREAGLI